MWHRLKTLWPSAQLANVTTWIADSKVGRLRVLLPSRPICEKLGWAGGGAVLLVAAFCLGNQWSGYGKKAPSTKSSGETFGPTGTPSSYGSQPVAYIFNGMPITRAELGEYLIARFGLERIEFFVNRKIVECICQSRKIYVSDAEVDAQLAEDLKYMNISRLEDFVNNILRPRNKTLYEYKEDVLRPKLALMKLGADRIQVTQEDYQKAFEAKYGPRVECRMIILLPEQKNQVLNIWEKVRNNAKEFDEQARKQSLPALAAKAGEIPPIHKHFGDKNIEMEAFRLQPGEVSRPLEMPDGSAAILRCVKHLAADLSRRLEVERVALHHAIVEDKTARVIPLLAQEMRQRADPKIILTRDSAAQGLDPRFAQLAPASIEQIQQASTRPIDVPPVPQAQRIEVPPAPALPANSSTPVALPDTKIVVPPSPIDFGSAPPMPSSAPSATMTPMEPVPQAPTTPVPPVPASTGKKGS